jgi:putative addiction module CopG family antidote
MGVVQLPEELTQAIDRQVELGRADSAEEFLKEAVKRMIKDADAAEQEMHAAIDAGLADAEAGRGVLVATQEDADRLHASLMERLQANLAAGQVV